MATSKYQDKIDFLNTYNDMRMRIIRLDDDRAELEQTFGDAGCYYGKGYHNSRLYKSLKEQFHQIAEDKRAAVIHQRRVRASIEAVPDEEYRQLLTLRYIEGMKWNKIAKIMVYDEGYIKGGKHRAALLYVQIPSQ